MWYAKHEEPAVQQRREKEIEGGRKIRDACWTHGLSASVNRMLALGIEASSDTHLRESPRCLYNSQPAPSNASAGYETASIHRCHMTLILSLATPFRIIQVSDRRLTMPDGTIYDDSANKALCVFCADARFAVAYCGLGVIGHPRRTDEWLLDYLYSIDAGKLRLMDIMNALTSQLTHTLRALPYPQKFKSLTIVGTGYFVAGPFVMSISNVFDQKMNPLDRVHDAFYPGLFSPDPPATRRAMKQVWLCVSHGANGALTKALRRRIRKLQLQGCFRRQAGRIAAAELVSIVRAAARTPSVGLRIGRNCMAVVTGPNEGLEFSYHPDKSSPLGYGPHLINDWAIAKNLKFWTGGGPQPEDHRAAVSVLLELPPEGRRGWLVCRSPKGETGQVASGGRVECGRMDPGPVEVLFRSPGWGSARSMIEVPEEGTLEVGLRVPRGGTLLVPLAETSSPAEVVLVDGWGVVWSEILFRVGGQNDIPRPAGRNVPGIGWAWEFSDLPPGTYTATVNGVPRQPVTIAAGEISIAP